MTEAVCKSCKNPKCYFWDSAVAWLCLDCFVMWALAHSKHWGMKD